MDTRQMQQLIAQKRREEKAMESQVKDMEMKARFWEAQFKIRHFSLEAEKLQKDYEEFLNREKERNEELRKRFEDQIKEFKEKEVVVDEQVQ